MHQPVAAWWAAGWKQLNPNMLWFVDRRLDRREGDLPHQAVTFWRLYRETCDLVGNFDREFGWFEFRSMVAKDGWSGATLRFFERVSQPRVEFRRDRFGPFYPVEVSWGDLPLRRIVDAKVKVLDRHNEQLEIPDEQLAAVVAVVRRSLVAASCLLDEIATMWWTMPTLHPTGEPGETFYGRKPLYFLWFRDLFNRLATLNPEAAAIEVRQWPANDVYFFGKLSIYAAMLPKVVSASQATALFKELSDEIFWEPRCQRELLFTLRARWTDLTSRQRRLIERRIAKGPARWKEEKASDFRRRRAVYSAARLAWLELNGCPLTPATSKSLEKLKGVDPNWSDSWAGDADRSLDSRGGMVARITDTRGIESVPIGKIVDEARRKTESRHGELQDFHPFEGLVAAQPFRSLAALRSALRNGDVPTDFWESLLANWPEATSLKLRWLAAYTVSNLPADALESLKYSVPRWFQKHLEALAEADRVRALAIFDKVIAVYVAAGPEVIKSSVGNTTIGGVIRDRSEVSIGKAINSPIGVLAEAIFNLMPDEPTENGPMPDGIEDRLSVLFGAKGDGGGHAACVLAQHFPWLDNWFSDWSSRVLRPMFALAHPLSEAVWHGYAAADRWPSTQTLRILCPSLLTLLKGEVVWDLDESEKRRLVQKMVILTRPRNDGGSLVSFKQAREVLIALDDKEREDAIWILGNIVSEKGAWNSFVKPFIEKAWPHQVKYRTERASRGFARLIEQSGDDFPYAVRALHSLLRPVTHLDMITYRLSKESEESTNDFAHRFPTETLVLLNALVADDRSQLPYELGKALEVIAEAAPALRQTKEWRRLYDLTL